MELEEDARALGEDMTAERWTRLAAKKTHYEDSELADPDDRHGGGGLAGRHINVHRPAESGRDPGAGPPHGHSARSGASTAWH